MSRLCGAIYAKRLPTSAVSIALALLAGVAAAPAGATSEIERVWSFNGGEVAIHTTNGKLVGTVITPTKFDECAHQAGEEMWTDMTLQPDGSYWGLHQWLFQGSCARNPNRGLTAWRVLQKPNGSKYLLVCFSEPGSSSQPTIAPSGAFASATFGCRESLPVAPLPVVSHVTSRQLPKSTVCVKQHSLRIKLHDPKRDPLKTIVVRIKGKKIADVHGVRRLRRGIVLKKLPTGTYTLKIVATTVLNQRLTGHRTYHSCGKNSSGNIPLHRLASRRKH